MTAADRILQHLARVGEATDQEMARSLELPEASVRRSRNFLVLDNLVTGMQGRGYDNTFVWRLTTSVTPIQAAV